MTANKAIRDLVQEGYLVRQSGIGTFVTDRRSESSLAEINNIADEVRSRGHEYANRVVSCEALNADDEVALRMGVRIGTRLFHSILIHLENGQPIQLEEPQRHQRQWSGGAHPGNACRLQEQGG